MDDEDSSDRGVQRRSSLQEDDASSGLGLRVMLLYSVNAEGIGTMLRCSGRRRWGYITPR